MMKPVRLVVLGIGSVRCAPSIIGSLAGYFGERDLEVRLYDEDRERLELFDALARRCFAFESSKHALLAFDDAYEAMEGADLVILAIGENCARKFLRNHPQVAKAKAKAGKGKAAKAPEEPRELTREEAVREAVSTLSRAIPDGAPILDFLRDVDISPDPLRTKVAWPPPLGEDERRQIPHEVLRWLKGEEGLAQLVDNNRTSPIKAWIDANAPLERGDGVLE